MKGFYFYNIPILYLFEDLFKGSSLLTIGGCDATTLSLLLERGVGRLVCLIGECSPAEGIPIKEGVLPLYADPLFLPFREGSFDTILCLESPFPNGGEEGFLHEVKRVLKGDGILILSIPGLRVDYLREVMADDAPPVDPPDPFRLIRLLKGAFRIVEPLTRYPFLSTVFRRGIDPSPAGTLAEEKRFAPEFILGYTFLCTDMEVDLDEYYHIQVPLSHILLRFRELKRELEGEILDARREKNALEERLKELEMRAGLLRGRLLTKEVVWSKIKGGLETILHHLREIFPLMEGEGVEDKIIEGIRGVEDFYSLIQSVERGEGEGPPSPEWGRGGPSHAGRVNIYPPPQDILVYPLPGGSPFDATPGWEGCLPLQAEYESSEKEGRDMEGYQVLLGLMGQVSDLNERYLKEVERGIERDATLQEARRKEKMLEENIREMEGELGQKEETLSHLKAEVEEMRENIIALSEGLQQRWDEFAGYDDSLLKDMEGGISSREEMESLSSMLREELEPVLSKMREIRERGERSLKDDLEMLNFEFYQKTAHLSALEEEMERERSRVEELESMLRDREKALEEALREIEALEGRVMRLSGEEGAGKERERRFHVEIEELKAQLTYQEMLLKKEEERRREDREAISSYELEIKERDELLKEREEELERLSSEREELLLQTIRLKEELIKKEEEIRFKESILSDGEVLMDEGEIRSFEEEIIKGIEGMDEEFTALINVGDEGDRVPGDEEGGLRDEIERQKADKLELELEREKDRKALREKDEEIAELRGVVEAQTRDFEKIKNKVREAIDYIADLHSKLDKKEKRILELEESLKGKGIRG